jgi:hypothetical protein
VSPLWRDEIAIYLAPRRLALVRRARGIEPRVVAATELALATGTFGEVGPVLARLGEVLSEPTWHNARARVVVADHPWARYGIVPWPTARLDAAGRVTHARYVLGDAFGEGMAEWAVTLADTPPGNSFVACAMPASFRSALEETLAPARLALASLHPRLIVAFNAWRHRLPADDAWFVTLDDDSMSAVHLANGTWDRVHTARLSPDWKLELQRLQVFGKLTRAAGAVGRMFVDAPACVRRGAGATTGIEWLEESAADGAQAHELALLHRMYA